MSRPPAGPAALRSPGPGQGPDLLHLPGPAGYSTGNSYSGYASGYSYGSGYGSYGSRRLLSAAGDYGYGERRSFAVAPLGCAALLLPCPVLTSSFVCCGAAAGGYSYGSGYSGYSYGSGYSGYGSRRLLSAAGDYGYGERCSRAAPPQGCAALHIPCPVLTTGCVCGAAAGGYSYGSGYSGYSYGSGYSGYGSRRLLSAAGGYGYGEQRSRAVAPQPGLHSCVPAQCSPAALCFCGAAAGAYSYGSGSAGYSYSSGYGSYGSRRRALSYGAYSYSSGARQLGVFGGGRPLARLGRGTQVHARRRPARSLRPGCCCCRVQLRLQLWELRRLLQAVRSSTRPSSVPSPNLHCVRAPPRPAAAGAPQPSSKCAAAGQRPR